MDSTLASTSMSSTNLSRLKASLSQSQSNTTKMMSRLHRFQDRLQSLDVSMRPVESQTARYTTARENIAATLIEVEKTYEYFRIAGDMEETVMAGLGPPPHTYFFEAVTQLSSAKEFFIQHKSTIKSAHTALNSVETLLQKAISKIVKELERLMSTFTDAVELLEDGQQYRVLDPVPPESAQQIKVIVDLLDENKQTAHYDVYKQMRIDYVQKWLRQHENNHLEEWNNLLLDVPYQKGTHPLASYYNLSCELLKSELNTWGLTLTTNSQSLDVVIGICDAVTSEIVKIVTPTLTADFRDKSIINFILKQSNSFLIRMDMLDIVMSKYEDMRDLLRPDFRHESTASTRLTTLRNSMISACIDSLNCLLTGTVDNDKEGKPEESCDLHPITGNVLYTCKELLGFTSIYARIYDLAKSLGIKVPTNVPSLPECVVVLINNLIASVQVKAARFNDPRNKRVSISGNRSLVVTASKLYAVGEKEADESLSVARQHLFLINNLFSIYLYLREAKSDLGRGDVVGGHGHGDALNKSKGKAGIPAPRGINDPNQLNILLEAVESKLSMEQVTFCDVICRAMAMSPSEVEEFAVTYAKDKGNKNRLLKAKFSVFNSGMDALLAQQGEWRVSAAGLRDQLAAQLVESIVPTYQHFYDTYSTVNFSKTHMSQYLKYKPEDVATALSAFFGKTTSL